MRLPPLHQHCSTWMPHPEFSKQSGQLWNRLFSSASIAFQVPLLWQECGFSLQEICWKLACASRLDSLRCKFQPQRASEKRRFDGNQDDLLSSAKTSIYLGLVSSLLKWSFERVNLRSTTTDCADFSSHYCHLGFPRHLKLYSLSWTSMTYCSWRWQSLCRTVYESHMSHLGGQEKDSSPTSNRSFSWSRRTAIPKRGADWSHGVDQWGPCPPCIETGQHKWLDLQWPRRPPLLHKRNSCHYLHC